MAVFCQSDKMVSTAPQFKRLREKKPLSSENAAGSARKKGPWYLVELLAAENDGLG